jgi:signal transduction histidine kinase
MSTVLTQRAHGSLPPAVHTRLIQEGFNRRYVLVPMLLAIVLVVLGFWVTETSRAEARDLADLLRARQDVMRLLAETGYQALEAQNAQRGFLLTGENQYLGPMESGLAETRGLLEQLQGRLEFIAPSEGAVVQEMKADLAVKADEMARAVTMVKEGRPLDALQLVKAEAGLDKTQSIINALQGLREREGQRFAVSLAEWTAAHRLNTMVNTAAVLFTVALLLVLGLLASRDIRRRETFAAQLTAQIDARTAELADLGQHMSRVVEKEKYALARELHDELGGLLVAMRIDMAQLRKKIGPTTDPDILARWARVEQSMAQGLELKRRVIEDLRPTLLDNMGLFTALRWLATQRAEQAQLALQMDGLDEDINVPPETAIAVFRAAQEAIANIIAHSGATKFSLEAIADDRLTLEIADNGTGMPSDAERRVGSHGLKQMRFRMEAVGGTFEALPRQPRGTIIRLSVAMKDQAPS